MSNTKNKKLKILSMVCAGLMASAVIIAPAVACSRTYTNKFFINYDIEVLVSSHNDKKSFKLKLPIKDSAGLNAYCRIHPTYKPNIEMTIWHYNPSTNRHEDHTKQLNISVPSKLIDDCQYLLIDLPDGDYHEKDNLAFTDLNHVIQGQSFDLYQSYFKYDESVKPPVKPINPPKPDQPIKVKDDHKLVDSGTQTDPITIPSSIITPSKPITPSTSESGTETDPVITPKPSKPTVIDSDTQTDTPSTSDSETQTDTPTKPSVSEGGTQTDTPSVSEGGTQTDPITPSPTPSVPTPDTKKDEVIVSGLEMPTKESDLNQIKFDFSKFTLKDENQKVLKLTLLDGNETKEINLTLSDDKTNAIADLKDLKAGTYKIAKLTLNGKEIDLGAIKDQEFKTLDKKPAPAPVVPKPVQPKPVEEVVPKVLFSFNTNKSDQSYYASITPDIVSFLKKHQSQIDQNDKIEFKVHLKQIDKANTQDQSLFQTDGTITYTLKDLIASEHPDLTRYALSPNSVNKTSLGLQEVSLNVKNSELLNQLKSAIEIKDSTNKVSPITFETKVSDTSYKHDLNPTISLTNFDQLNQLYYDNSIAQHHPDLYLNLINKPSTQPSHGRFIPQSAPESYFNINGALNQYLKTNDNPVDPDDSIVFNYSINQLNNETHKIDSTNHSLTLKLIDLKNIDADNFKKALLNINDQKDQCELLKKPDTQLVFNNVVFNIKDAKLLFNISNLFKVYDLNDQTKWTSLTSLTTPNDQNKNQFDLKKAIVVKDYDPNTYQEWSNSKPQPKVSEVVPQMLFSVNSNEADKSLHVSLTPDIISFLKKHQSEIDPNDQIELNIHLAQLNKANTPDESVVKDNKTIVYKLKDLISSDHPDLTRLNLDPNTIDRTSLILQKMSIDVKNSKLLDQLKTVIKVKDAKNNNDIQVPFTTKISDTKYEHEFKKPPLFISKFDELNQKYYDHYVNNMINKRHPSIDNPKNPDLYLTLSKKEESTSSESLNYFNIKGPLNQYLKKTRSITSQEFNPNESVVQLNQDDYMELNYSIDQLNDQTHKIDSTPYSLKLKLSDLRNIDSDEIDMSLLTSNNHKDQYELLKQPNTRLVLHSFTFNTKDRRLSSNISTFFRIVDQKDQNRWTALPNLTKVDSEDPNQLNLEKSIVVKDFDENTLKQWSKKEILAKETVITPVGQPISLPLTNSLFTKTNKLDKYSETQEWLTLSKPYTQTYHIENIDLDTLPDNVSVVVSYDGMPSITVKVPKSSFTNINQLHTSCDVNITLPINEYLQKMDINNSEILAPTLKSVTLQYTIHSQDKHFKTFDLLKLNPTISTLNISDEDKIEISTDPQKYMKQLPPVFEDLHIEKSSNPSFDSYFVKFKVILTTNYAKLIEHLDNKFNVELKSSNKIVYTKEINNVGGNNYASSNDYVIINHGDKDHQTNLDHNTTLFVTLKVPKSAIKNENSKLTLSKFEFGGINFALTREKQRPKLFNISLKKSWTTKTRLMPLKISYLNNLFFL